MRRVIYISGTRADYGLMSRSLKLWHQSKALEVSVCVTGMHLLEEYGLTVNEIYQDNLRVCGEIPVDLLQTNGVTMAKAIAAELSGIVDVLSEESPDLIVLLGDRGEMIAGALAALHLNIPIVHIHGGELSGTVDEPIRHAISKLSHYHFTATEGAKRRLIKMGEDESRVFVVGAPGLDGLADDAHFSRQELCDEVGFLVHKKIILMVFHPVVQYAGIAADEVREIWLGLQNIDAQILWLLPNADAGGAAIKQEIEKIQVAGGKPLHVITHLPRVKFVSWMKHVDMMLGNSSSGIIEAATFGTSVVNIGLRQQGRERSNNLVDVDVDAQQIRCAVLSSLEASLQKNENIYGSGASGKKMLKLLTELPLNQKLLDKINAY